MQISNHSKLGSVIDATCGDRARVSTAVRRCEVVSVELEVQLVRVKDAVSIAGSLVVLTRKHLDDFTTVWRERLRTSDDVDQYWDWEKKQRIYVAGGIGMYEGYAIECDQMTQGMMILQTRGYRSQVEASRRIVYVHSLATAPWNRISNPDPNGFRAVGGALLRFAKYRSEQLGYGGLVGLHSLPTAEEFYRKMGMIDGGVDVDKEKLTYFEWYHPSSSGQEELGVGEDLEPKD